MVHENRGLNPHIEDIARRFALANFMAFAPDGLTSVGGFPGDDYRGGQMFAKVDRGKMTEDMVASDTPCGPDVERHVQALQKYADAGFDELYVQQIGPEQDAFFEAYREHVLPRLR